MQKQYITAQLSIVRIAAQDIIVTSPTLNSNSAGLEMGSSWGSVPDGAIGYGED